MRPLPSDAACRRDRPAAAPAEWPPCRARGRSLLFVLHHASRQRPSMAGREGEALGGRREITWL
jgi:hypothetical protein